MLKAPLSGSQYLRPKVRGIMAQGKTVSLHSREQDPFFAPIFRHSALQHGGRYLVGLQGANNYAYDIA